MAGYARKTGAKSPINTGKKGGNILKPKRGGTQVKKLAKKLSKSSDQASPTRKSLKKAYAKAGNRSFKKAYKAYKRSKTLKTKTPM